MSKVYIETSIISYLAARPSRDVIVAAHQQITDEWWHTQKDKFDLFASQLVRDEAQAGDPKASQKRLSFFDAIAMLEVTEEALKLAEDLVAKGPLPPNVVEDAIHIAVTVTNGIDYLLTWNCKHLANAAMRNKIESICRTNGYEPAIICTPEELQEG